MYKVILIIQLICCLILLLVGLFAISDVIFPSAVALGSVWGVWVSWEMYKEFNPVTESDSDKDSIADIDKCISSLSEDSEIKTDRKNCNGN